MTDVEKVIQQGLNRLLTNYIDRHELLEKTHEQLMRLPSIAEEFNKNSLNSLKEFETDSDSNSDPNSDPNPEVKAYGIIHCNNNNEIINELQMKFSTFETRMSKLEENNSSLVYILNKIMNKMEELYVDIKELQDSKNETQASFKASVEKSSIVRNSENENVEIHIDEPKDVELNQEYNEESSDNNLSSLSIASSEVKIITLDDNIEPQHSTETTYETIKKLDIEEEAEEEEAEEEEAEEEEDEEEEAEEEEDEEEEAEEEEAEEEEAEEVEAEEEEAEEVEAEEEEAEEEEAEEEEVEEEEVEEKEVEEKEVEEKKVEEEAEVVETETKEQDEESIETETKEESNDIESEEEEVFEIEIDDKNYCTNDDENGFIWELTEDGEQGEKVGYLKDGEPFFYADEN
jgi:hypothetical protein